MLRTARELRGDNHWALCAAADLDDVEAGLLHAAMIDTDEHGARRITELRHDDASVARAGPGRRAKGLSTRPASPTPGGDHDLERRTDELTAPALASGRRTSDARFVKRSSRIIDTARPDRRCHRRAALDAAEPGTGTHWQPSKSDESAH
ncbi:MAG: hypothetical protein R2695_20530 [Acidimicrobiales bacterium]